MDPSTPPEGYVYKGFKDVGRVRTRFRENWNEFNLRGRSELYGEAPLYSSDTRDPTVSAYKTEHSDIMKESIPIGDELIPSDPNGQHECLHCNLMFKTLGGRLAHVSNEHRASQQVRCHTCTQTYNNLMDMTECAIFTAYHGVKNDKNAAYLTCPYADCSGIRRPDWALSISHILEHRFGLNGQNPQTIRQTNEEFESNFSHSRILKIKSTREVIYMMSGYLFQNQKDNRKVKSKPLVPILRGYIHLGVCCKLMCPANIRVYISGTTFKDGSEIATFVGKQAHDHLPNIGFYLKEMKNQPKPEMDFEKQVWRYEMTFLPNEDPKGRYLQYGCTNINCAKKMFCYYNSDNDRVRFLSWCVTPDPHTHFAMGSHPPNQGTNGGNLPCVSQRNLFNCFLTTTPPIINVGTLDFTETQLRKLLGLSDNGAYVIKMEESQTQVVTVRNFHRGHARTASACLPVEFSHLRITDGRSQEYPTFNNPNRNKMPPPPPPSIQRTPALSNSRIEEIAGPLHPMGPPVPERLFRLPLGMLSPGGQLLSPSGQILPPGVQQYPQLAKGPPGIQLNPSAMYAPQVEIDTPVLPPPVQAGPRRGKLSEIKRRRLDEDLDEDLLMDMESEERAHEAANTEDHVSMELGSQQSLMDVDMEFAMNRFGRWVGSQESFDQEKELLISLGVVAEKAEQVVQFNMNFQPLTIPEIQGTLEDVRSAIISRKLTIADKNVFIDSLRKFLIRRPSAAIHTVEESSEWEGVMGQVVSLIKCLNILVSQEPNSIPLQILVPVLEALQLEKATKSDVMSPFVNEISRHFEAIPGHKRQWATLLCLKYGFSQTQTHQMQFGNFGSSTGIIQPLGNLCSADPTHMSYISITCKFCWAMSCDKHIGEICTVCQCGKL